MECTVGISVVIPVYNCEQYIAEAVESVLSQPYKAIQIILVNDGSKDNSPAICDEYASKYDNVYVLHQKNSGVSVARNTGIEHVLADENPVFRNGYVAFLDADDCWVGQFFESDQIGLLNKGYDLIGFQSCECNGEMTRHQKLAPVEEGCIKGGTRSVWINSRQHFGASLYSLRILEKYSIRFLAGLRNNEDHIFSIQFRYLANTLCSANRLLYMRRNNQNSVTHRSRNMRRNVIEIYTEIMDAWIASDSLMEQYQTEERGLLREGHAMAAVYITEMHQEHYRQFGRQRELDQLFLERPDLLGLITSEFAINRPDSGLKWQAMKAHPVKYRLTCRMKGTVDFILRSVYLLMRKSKWLASIIDKKRYPHPIEK